MHQAYSYDLEDQICWLKHAAPKYLREGVYTMVGEAHPYSRPSPPPGCELWAYVVSKVPHNERRTVRMFYLQPGEGLSLHDAKPLGNYSDRLVKPESIVAGKRSILADCPRTFRRAKQLIRPRKPLMQRIKGWFTNANPS